jgi:hypothetical protein
LHGGDAGFTKIKRKLVATEKTNNERKSNRFYGEEIV